MGELQRPVQLGSFLALQRLHLENMAELLQTEWAMKVRVCLHMQLTGGAVHSACLLPAVALRSCCVVCVDCSS